MRESEGFISDIIVCQDKIKWKDKTIKYITFIVYHSIKDTRFEKPEKAIYSQ